MTTPAAPVTLSPLLGLPEVQEGDDVAAMVLKALQHHEIQLMDGDILVVSSKVVSKAMGLRAPASNQAQVVLSQSVRVVAERMTPSGVTRIVEAIAGPVMTAAGVDASNTADESVLLLLPEDPDVIAAQIREDLEGGWMGLFGKSPLIGVILSDTAGRPWRNGQTDFALGAAGVLVVDDLRGSTDGNGRLLSVTERCVADEIAAAADLVKGKTAGVPVAHVRGLGQYVQDHESTGGAGDLVRTGPQDWFGYGRVEAVRAALSVEPGSTQASDVGIPFIHQEDAVTRARRALRVALLTCPGSAGQVDGDQITLTAPNEFMLGVVAARTEVAMRGEELTATCTRSQTHAPVAGSSTTDEPSVLIQFH